MTSERELLAYVDWLDTCHREAAEMDQRTTMQVLAEDEGAYDEFNELRKAALNNGRP